MTLTDINFDRKVREIRMIFVTVGREVCPPFESYARLPKRTFHVLRKSSSKHFNMSTPTQLEFDIYEGVL